MDWPTIKSALLAVAPALAGSIGTPAAGVAVAALERVLGVSGTPDNIANALVGATPEQLAALKKEDNAHAEKMAQIEVDKFSTLVSDKNSAREREVKTGDSITPRILAGVILVLYCTVQIMIFQIVVDDKMRDFVMRTLGTLDGLTMLVFSYYFGAMNPTKKDI